MTLQLFLEIWKGIVTIEGDVITVKKTEHFERRWMWKFESDVKDLKENYTINYV